MSTEDRHVLLEVSLIIQALVVMCEYDSFHECSTRSFTSNLNITRDNLDN